MSKKCSLRQMIRVKEFEFSFFFFVEQDTNVITTENYTDIFVIFYSSEFFYLEIKNKKRKLKSSNSHMINADSKV